MNNGEGRKPQPDEEKRGLICVKCGCEHFYTRRTTKVRGGRILRERECRYCGRMYRTYEEALDSY